MQPSTPTPHYGRTIFTAFSSFVGFAAVNNFLPLLFLTLRDSYGLRLDQLAWLVSFNFIMQLTVDFAAMFFVDRLGYRRSLVAGQGFLALGLIALAVLPKLMPNTFLALHLAVLIYACGGGLVEVLTSPLIDATPSKHKSTLMSVLHSFYCWGHLLVVILSTLYFYLFGVENWPVLAVIWAILPLVNMLLFTQVPIPEIPGDTGLGHIVNLLRSPILWFFLVVMMAAGAMEQAVSQWSSSFAEAGLGLSKTQGDLAGPMLFALMMGLSRAIYGQFGSKWPLRKVIWLSAILGIGAYLLASLSPEPALAFVGVALVGFSVGIMWPGTLSVASEEIPRGGTPMFAFMALAGDLGCALGPMVVGLVAGDNTALLSRGILIASVFPILLVLTYLVLMRKQRAQA